MHPRHSHARNMLLAAASITLALSLAGCKPKLNEAMVRDFMDAQIKANDAMDYAAVCDAYADDADYTIVVAGNSRPTYMTRSEICASVSKGYAEAKQQGMTAHSEFHIDKIVMKGEVAQVSGTLTETMQAASGAGTTNTSTVMESIKLVYGKPKILHTAQIVRAVTQ